MSELTTRLAVALLEAAVRASVRARAPRRTTAAVASAVTATLAGRVASLGGPGQSHVAASTGPGTEQPTPGSVASAAPSPPSAALRRRRAARRFRKKQLKAMRSPPPADAAMGMDSGDTMGTHDVDMAVSVEAPLNHAEAGPDAPAFPAPAAVPASPTGVGEAAPVAAPSPGPSPSTATHAATASGEPPSAREAVEQVSWPPMVLKEVLHAHDGSFEDAAFAPGSAVEVMVGDLAGLTGVVVRTGADSLVLRVPGRGDVSVSSLVCRRCSA